MYRRSVALAFMFLLGTVLNPGTARGQLGKALARGAERNLTRSAGRSWFSIFRRDLVRDRATRAEKLASNRSVFRYTTKAQAGVESRAGIAAGSHLTSHAVPGRPSASLAQKRLGLPLRPTVREKVLLPKGTAVQMNKALGGKPGYGEIRLARRVKPESIRKVTPLQRGHANGTRGHSFPSNRRER
jgi:hypothetical protein